MNRRDFLKLATRAAAAGLVLPTLGRSMVGYTGEFALWPGSHDDSLDIWHMTDELAKNFRRQQLLQAANIILPRGHAKTFMAREITAQLAVAFDLDVKLVKP